MNDGRIEQVGAPRELYERPANDFVMSFLGPVSELGGTLVRPHDLLLTSEPRDGASEAMVARVVHLGFEVRVELVLADGAGLLVQLTRGEAEELESRHAATSSGSRPTARAPTRRSSAPEPAPLPRDPGFGVVREPLDLGRQVAGQEVGQRDLLRHRRAGGAHGDPDPLQRLRGAAVLDALGPLAADGGERSLDGADDVRDGDLAGRLERASSRRRPRGGSRRCPRGAARRGCSPGTSGGSPGAGDRVALHRAVAAPRELDGGSDCVVGFGGHAH